MFLPFILLNDQKSHVVGNKSHEVENKILDSDPETNEDPDDFPETHSGTLRAAAQGDWSGFFQQYFRPTWNEVVVACRCRNIPLVNTEDLFGELIVRLLRDGRFNPELQKVLREHHLDDKFRGNLVARYLVARQLPMKSARFRTYLKQVIRNLILECLRDRPRQPKSLESPEHAELQPAIYDSVSHSLERRWIAESLREAALELKLESQQARTRGKRRMFQVVYHSIVEGRTSVEIAEHFGLDRSTISELLTLGRAKFVKLLKLITGLTNLEELKRTVADAPEALRDAFVEAGKDEGTVFVAGQSADRS